MLLLEGRYTGVHDGSLTLSSGPIFGPDEKIFVFDVEKVMIDNSGNLDPLAKRVVEHAVNHVDRVVGWSLSAIALGMAKTRPFFDAHLEMMDYPFSNIDQKIGGALWVSKERGRVERVVREAELDQSKHTMVKYLGLLTSNLYNVVAIEDVPDRGDQTFFEPLNRVVQHPVGGNLWKTYQRALDLLDVRPHTTRVYRRMRREAIMERGAENVLAA